MGRRMEYGWKDIVGVVVVHLVVYSSGMYVLGIWPRQRSMAGQSSSYATTMSHSVAPVDGVCR